MATGNSHKVVIEGSTPSSATKTNIGEKMSTPELIYELTKFFFSNVGHFLLLMLFILTVRGDVTKLIIKVKDFFNKLIFNYKNKLVHVKPPPEYLDRDTKKILNVNKEKES